MVEIFHVLFVDRWIILLAGLPLSVLTYYNLQREQQTRQSCIQLNAEKFSSTISAYVNCELYYNSSTTNERGMHLSCHWSPASLSAGIVSWQGCWIIQAGTHIDCTQWAMQLHWDILYISVYIQAGVCRTAVGHYLKKSLDLTVFVIIKADIYNGLPNRLGSDIMM